MSYLDRPNWSGDVLVGAFSAVGAASATAIGLVILGFLVVEPLIVVTGWFALLIGFFIVMWVSLLALLLFGVPGTLLLRLLRAETGFSYGLLGAGSGVAATLLLFRESLWPWWTFVAVAAGAVGGVVWWRGYRRDFQDFGDYNG